MKIIDLLNKIANGEEVPEKIKYRNKIFIYNKDNQCYIVENYNEYDDLHMSLSNHKGTDLLYEVEILEEEKKIPEKLSTWFSLEKDCENDNIQYANHNFKTMYEKINEICDFLKSKGE